MYIYIYTYIFCLVFVGNFYFFFFNKEKSKLEQIYKQYTPLKLWLGKNFCSKLAFLCSHTSLLQALHSSTLGISESQTMQLDQLHIPYSARIRAPWSITLIHPLRGCVCSTPSDVVSVYRPASHFPLAILLSSLLNIFGAPLLLQLLHYSFSEMIIYTLSQNVCGTNKRS